MKRALSGWWPRVLPLWGVLACATGNIGQPDRVGNVAMGRPLPDLRFRDLDGKTHALSAFRGKVVLLDIWATWCPPCKEEMPLLNRMAERLRGRGIEIVAVSIDQERDNVSHFVGGLKPLRLKVLHDPDGEVANRLQPDVMPTSYLLDRQGVVRGVNQGFHDGDEASLESRLLSLAASPP